MSEGADLFGEAHIRRYRETDGEVGHIWFTIHPKATRP